MKSLDEISCRGEEFRLHPLGFYYFKTLVETGVWRRYHIWLPKYSVGIDNDRHQHSFDIRSQVLFGRLRSELFDFHESPCGTEYEFSVKYENNRSILSPTGRVGELVSLSAFENIASTSYFLRAGVIHQVSILEVPCVTVLTTEERGISIHSYGQEQSEPPFERRLANGDEAKQIGEVLRNCLSINKLSP